MKVRRFNENSYLSEWQMEPEIGDYVICEDSQTIDAYDSETRKIADFLSGNIGMITQIYNESNSPIDDMTTFLTNPYFVIYSNIPDDISEWFNFDNKVGRIFRRDEIKYWNKDKKELEHIVDANKYNL